MSRFSLQVTRTQCDIMSVVFSNVNVKNTVYVMCCVISSRVAAIYFGHWGIAEFWVCNLSLASLILKTKEPKPLPPNTCPGLKICQQCFCHWGFAPDLATGAYSLGFPSLVLEQGRVRVTENKEREEGKERKGDCSTVINSCGISNFQTADSPTRLLCSLKCLQ